MRNTSAPSTTLCSSGVDVAFVRVNPFGEPYLLSRWPAGELLNIQLVQVTTRLEVFLGRKALFTNMCCVRRRHVLRSNLTGPVLCRAARRLAIRISGVSTLDLQVGPAQFLEPLAWHRLADEPL
jgi:hypothetical protein